jgi:hypothetical protein
MSEKQLRRQPPKEGVVLPISSDNGHLINQTIVQILVEKNAPEEVKELMKAELDYNRERLSILREHAENHPDAIEERRGKRFRRTQYLFLMAFLPVLVSAIYYMPTAIALALCTMAMMITAGIILNGRDRDGDSESLIKLIEKLLARRET